MDNRHYESLIGEMQSFFEEQGITEKIDGIFANDKKSISIKYDEPRQMYCLSVADFDSENNTLGEYKEINAWLFDDTQNAKDAQAVGIDFVNSLRKEFGIKKARNINSNIDLPTVSKSDSMNITGFTKKMLDIFPSLKEEYKAHMTVYGNFLYINFFGEHLVPLLKNLFSTGTKKQIKKLYDVFEDAYIKGDSDTVNIMVALLCASSYQDKKADASIKEMLSENSHFLTSYYSFIPAFASNKKLISALIK